MELDLRRTDGFAFIHHFHRNGSLCAGFTGQRSRGYAVLRQSGDISVLFRDAPSDILRYFTGEARRIGADGGKLHRGPGGINAVDGADRCRAENARLFGIGYDHERGRHFALAPIGGAVCKNQLIRARILREISGRTAAV